MIMGYNYLDGAVTMRQRGRREAQTIGVSPTSQRSSDAVNRPSFSCQSQSALRVYPATVRVILAAFTSMFTLHTPNTIKLPFLVNTEPFAAHTHTHTYTQTETHRQIHTH